MSSLELLPMLQMPLTLRLAHLILVRIIYKVQSTLNLKDIMMMNVLALHSHQNMRLKKIKLKINRLWKIMSELIVWENLENNVTNLGKDTTLIEKFGDVFITYLKLKIIEDLAKPTKILKQFKI
jgi:hypothetical protein